MPKIQFQSIKFRGPAMAIVDRANDIIAEYAAMGYRLTLRQLFYQFVSRDWLPNKQSEYKRLGSIINDARLAGLIDWNAIEDRGRNLLSLSTRDSPSDIVEACAQQFRFDLWQDQDHYIETWIEKEALIGVVSVPCMKWRVPHFACKGYTSQSEMWDAGYNRLRAQRRAGKRVTIIHLGDHDPSGIDMTRDIKDRLAMFAGGRIEVVRVALTMEQVEEYDPPPNPAKVTDSRFTAYEEQYGDESWELDALSPDTIGALIERQIINRIDAVKWDKAKTREDEAKETLLAVSDRWDEVQEYLKGADE